MIISLGISLKENVAISEFEDEYADLILRHTNAHQLSCPETGNQFFRGDRNEILELWMIFLYFN